MPGLLCNSCREGVTRSVQATKSAIAQNCPRSPKLAPNSNASESPPLNSRTDPREGPKQDLEISIPLTLLSVDYGLEIHGGEDANCVPERAGAKIGDNSTISGESSDNFSFRVL